MLYSERGWLYLRAPKEEAQTEADESLRLSTRIVAHCLIVLETSFALLRHSELRLSAINCPTDCMAAAATSLFALLIWRVSVESNDTSGVTIVLSLWGGMHGKIANAATCNCTKKSIQTYSIVLMSMRLCIENASILYSIVSMNVTPCSRNLHKEHVHTLQCSLNECENSVAGILLDLENHCKERVAASVQTAFLKVDCCCKRNTFVLLVPDAGLLKRDCIQFWGLYFT